MSSGDILSIALESLDECFQGVIPAIVCTAAPDGEPNITNLSIVLRLGEQRVVLSRQFFNKTARNLMVNPRLQVLVMEPSTGRQFRLDLVHERTESEGPLFDQMQATLDVVASHSGMTDVFKLRGVDICRVLACQQVPSDTPVAAPNEARVETNKLDACSQRLVRARTVDDLITVALQSFDELFGYERSLFFALDEPNRRLYAVGSHGLASSPAGAEVELGVGTVGVAAQRRHAVRISHATRGRIYAETVRQSLQPGDSNQARAISLADTDVLSELAVPVLARDELLGVLCFQSARAGRFSAEDQDLTNVVSRQIGLQMALLRLESVEVIASPSSPSPTKTNATVKYYAADDSVFVDDAYVIKGVAGRLLWRLLQAYVQGNRTEFSNREFRLDPSLDLPGYKDNLETRLISLRKRLEVRCSFLKITSTGRGKFSLAVEREVVLQEAD